MFERIKCYRKLRKANKFLRGVKKCAELTGDEEQLQETNYALYINACLEKKMWHNRKVAERYNLECIKNGL